MRNVMRNAMRCLLRGGMVAAGIAVTVGLGTTAPIINGFDEVAVPIAEGDTQIEQVVVWAVDDPNFHRATTFTHLVAGVTYTLEVDGTWKTLMPGGGSEKFFADAECATDPAEPGTWRPTRAGYEPTTFDLVVHGQAVEWTPLGADANGCDSTDHRYRTLYTPTSTGPAEFWLVDGGYADNEGSLTVTVHHHADLAPVNETASTVVEAREQAEEDAEEARQQAEDEAAQRKAEAEERLEEEIGGIPTEAPGDLIEDVEERKAEAEEDAGEAQQWATDEAENHQAEAEQRKARAEEDAGEAQQWAADEAEKRRAEAEEDAEALIGDGDPGPIAGAVLGAVDEVERQKAAAEEDAGEAHQWAAGEAENRRAEADQRKAEAEEDAEALIEGADPEADPEAVTEAAGAAAGEAEEAAGDAQASASETAEEFGDDPVDPLPNEGPSPDPGDEGDGGGNDPGGDDPDEGNQPDGGNESENGNEPESRGRGGGASDPRTDEGGLAGSPAVTSSGGTGPNAPSDADASEGASTASDGGPIASNDGAGTAKGSAEPSVAAARPTSAGEYEFIPVDVPTFDSPDDEAASGIEYGRTSGSAARPQSRVVLLVAAGLVGLATLALGRRVLTTPRNAGRYTGYRYR